VPCILHPDINNLKLPKPADLINIGYQLFMMVIILFHYFSIPWANYFLLYHIAIIVLLFGLANLKQNIFVKKLRDFNPILIIPTSFAELHYLVHNINQVDFDQLLINIDYSLFGTHPTVFLEHWANPVLVEYLQIVYVSFYFLPMILGAILYLRKDREGFDYFNFVIVFGFYFSYLTYFFVPAIGPRFTLDYLQTGPVRGLWVTDGLRNMLDSLENIQRDAFPSGHTEITLLTMIYSWKYSRKFFWILSVIGSSLIFSTVFLRYHYVIDVIAGILLTFIVVLLARPLYDQIRQWSLKKLVAEMHQ
jgi:membrane-associated phospholipid phosphatase